MYPTNTTALSEQEIDRLTVWKWRYSLEAHGFARQQAARLLFVRWLVQCGRLNEREVQS